MPDPIKVLIYGVGGCGKSELAALVEKVGVKPLFFDVEDSTKYINCARIPNLSSYTEVRSAMQDEETLKPFNAIVLDSLTKMEELAQTWVIQNIPHEKGHTIRGIEDYGWGKGYTHVYEAMLAILGDLDQQVRRGRHVIITAHECVNKPENPEGDNYAVTEPRLMTTKDAKNSLRYKVREWVDHLLLIKYDVALVDGKAKGSGTRAIYPQAMPSFWAKSRTLQQPIIYSQGDPELWRQLFKKGVA